MLFYVLLSAGIISCIAFNVLRVREGGVKALLIKGLTSVLFVSCGAAAAMMNTASENFSFALLVIVGLVFGLMGDIWLDLKWVYPQDNDIFTFAGFGAFMTGHIIFLAGLFINYVDFTQIKYIIIPAILAVVLAVGTLVIEKPMKMVYGKFKAITAIYGFVLAFMTFLSASLAMMNKFENMTLNFMFAGGVFFLISDLILSGTYFGEGKRRPVDVITNHTTYYTAQFLIAASLMFI